MTELIFIGVVLLVIAIAAPRYGVDSHTSDSWTAGRGAAAPRRRHTVRADAAALWAFVRTPMGRSARA
jgi:hypothetical protein